MKKKLSITQLDEKTIKFEDYKDFIKYLDHIHSIRTKLNNSWIEFLDEDADNDIYSLSNPSKLSYFDKISNEIILEITGSFKKKRLGIGDEGYCYASVSILVDEYKASRKDKYLANKFMGYSTFVEYILKSSTPEEMKNPFSQFSNNGTIISDLNKTIFRKFKLLLNTDNSLILEIHGF